jgi:ATP-dependent Lhr-like helicase
MAALPLARVPLRSASPFALPLMVERLREQLSTEKVKDRLDRLLAEAEAALAEADAPPRRRRAGAASSKPSPRVETINHESPNR